MAEGRQIAHHGEAIVLRTWPFHEADLLVSLFTRDAGKVKGVARHAMRSRRRFGGALEPATYVRAHYTEKPKQDLVRLDSFEILWSPMTAPVDALRLAGMQLVVEVLEEAMPEGAPEDNVFRLAMACLTGMGTCAPTSQKRDVGHPSLEPSSQARDVGWPGGRAGVSAAVGEKRGASVGMTGLVVSPVWLAVTYFCVWMNRLMGWWPELGHCAVCGLDLRGADVWWSPVADGVTCRDDRRAQSHVLLGASVAEAQGMARTGLEKLLEEPWPEERARDLRAFAVAVLERNLERRIRSAAGL